MGEHPAGGSTSDDVQIRTFLIADVRGYTIFTNQRGDEAAAKLAAKFADLAEETIAARGGSVIELRGDEALAVFSSARQAIRAALDLQARFVEETLADPSLPLPGGDRPRCGRGGAGRGRLPRRRAEPCRPALRSSRPRRGPRECGSRAPRAQDRRRDLRRSRHRPAEGSGGTRPRDQGDPGRRRPSGSPEAVRATGDQHDAAATARRAPNGVDRRHRDRCRDRARRGCGPAAPVRPRASSRSPGNGLQLLDASSHSNGDGIASRSRASPGGITAGAGFIWSRTPRAVSVPKVDPETHAAVDTIAVGGDPTGIAFGAGSLWVVASNAAEVDQDRSVERPDRRTGSPSATGRAQSPRPRRTSGSPTSATTP